MHGLELAIGMLAMLISRGIRRGFPRTRREFLTPILSVGIDTTQLLLRYRTSSRETYHPLGESVHRGIPYSMDLLYGRVV